MCYHIGMTEVNADSGATLERTPLFALHQAAGARLVPFAGWEMPVQYAGVMPEVRAVREGVGLFDVSHMARIRVHGKDAFDFLQYLVVSDLAKLPEEGGRGQYSLLCMESGSIIDDIIVYRLGPAEFIVVANASNRKAVLSWMRHHVTRFEVLIEDETYLTALIAVQGPKALALLDRISDRDLAVLPRFGLDESVVAQVQTMAARTGYTGEEGAELFCASADAPRLWQALVEAGGVPCGLGARDVCRLEAALPLYGHEMNEHITPYSARLGWVVRTEKTADFLGKRTLTELKNAPRTRVLVGIEMENRAIARDGYPVRLRDSEEVIGQVTSGTFSPTLGKGIALVRLEAAHSETGTLLEVLVRDTPHPARIVALPFYKNV